MKKERPARKGIYGLWVGAVVYTSAAATGPYVARGNINRYGPFRESQLSFIIVPAQQTYVAEVGGAYVWMGDLWDSYVVPGTGRNDKRFDYQAWLPLEFDSTGNISKLAWQDQWALQL
jgi:hypothetical protein